MSVGSCLAQPSSSEWDFNRGGKLPLLEPCPLEEGEGAVGFQKSTTGVDAFYLSQLSVDEDLSLSFKSRLPSEHFDSSNCILIPLLLFSFFPSPCFLSFASKSSQLLYYQANLCCCFRYMAFLAELLYSVYPYSGSILQSSTFILSTLL